jgi:hypothetical protein
VSASPTWLPPLVLGASIAVIAAVLIGLYRALAFWHAPERRSVVLGASVCLVGWLLVAVALALNGVYRAGPDDTPTIQYGILLPILIGVAVARRSRSVARVIGAVPRPWLIGVQVFRVLGFVFLLLYAAGRLPGLFAWPAGVGDVITGGLAPAVALAYSRDPTRRTAVILWNAFGLLDLFVAVSTGFLTSPSRLSPFAFTPPNELITAYPLVLIPTFLVPLAVLLHITSLARLAPKTRRVPVPAERPQVAGAPLD